MTDPPEYGETWVYESIVGAAPGVNLSGRRAALVQFGLFEAGVLALALAYGLADAAVAVVAVSTLASLALRVQSSPSA